MIHHYVDCEPYAPLWYIFCLRDMVQEKDYDKWEVSGDINEVTCPECLRIDKQLEDEMLCRRAMNGN